MRGRRSGPLSGGLVAVVNEKPKTPSPGASSGSVCHSQAWAFPLLRREPSIFGDCLHPPIHQTPDLPQECTLVEQEEGLGSLQLSEP